MDLESKFCLFSKFKSFFVCFRLWKPTNYSWTEVSSMSFLRTEKHEQEIQKNDKKCFSNITSGIIDNSR